MATWDNRTTLGLPYRPFLYTLDQIQDLLLVADLQPLLFWDRRSTGIHNPKLIKTINIMPDGVTPQWRVEEVELIRWMRIKGFRIFYRTNRYR